MIRVYFTPLNDLGEFSTEVEVTKDVIRDSIGKIKRNLDNSTFDIGILRFNNLNIRMRNSHGRYSDVDNLNSIFRYRRSGSKVRVTWAPAEPAICGVAICGETILSEEVDIYNGILNDEAAKMDIDEQVIEFQILSYDSQFAKVICPYSSLTGADTLQNILYKTLNQTAITKYLTVSLANLALTVNYIPDSLDWFENKTGREVIEKIMLASNSVIFVQGTTVKSQGRTPGGSVAHHFYGQASDLGNENIIDIMGFRNGQNRIINFVRWKDSSTASQDSQSIDTWGALMKEIDAEFVTDATKQGQTCSSIVTEFKNPKKEFSLKTFLNADTIELKFLDRVDIDYPSIHITAGKYMPIVGLTKIDDVESPLPHNLWDFKLDPADNFKIMGMEIDLKREEISFEMRGI